MQDEDKSDVSCNHKKSPAVGLNLGVNICDPAMPISLSLPLVSSDSPSLSSSSSSSSSSSLSPHLQFTSLAPIHSIDAADPELSPPDSGRSSMGDPLVGGLAPFFSAALSLSPTPNVWATTADVSHSSPGTEASALGMQLPKSPRAGAGGSSSSPISPFSTTNPTWSVYGSGTVPRKASPTFGNLWNSVPATAWTGNRFPRSTSYPGRNNIFGPATNSLTLAPPPALEVTSADEGSAYLYQDQYGMAPNLLDNSLRSADYFFHDMNPHESDIYAGKSYYGYGLDLGDVGYTGEDFVNGSSLNASNLGIHGVSIPPLALQDGMGYMHRGIPSPSQRLSPRSPVMSSGGMETTERYSRKVFVGGLPPDIDEEEINASFRRFGSLVVDWPHKAESKSYFPPKGYAFLLFQEEVSVQKLIEACMSDEDKLYLYVSSPTIKDKPVQIRPWKLSDADFVLDASLPLDPRKTVFVGGVPRPLKAVELALIMDRLYGGVCYAGIDIDPELKYPKGAGRVAFSNQQSYIAAISARFVQLQHGDIDKRVEVKPYVLDDQFCDECHGSNSAGRFAPFFCSNINCLQYYCESCWAAVHSQAGREFHKPLVKEGADRPRAVHFRW